MELLVSKKEQELIRKYGLTSKDLLESSLIILDGLLIKDREYPIDKLEGEFDLTNLNGNTRSIIVGCRTVDDKLRVYRNYKI